MRVRVHVAPRAARLASPLGAPDLYIPIAMIPYVWESVLLRWWRRWRNHNAQRHIDECWRLRIDWRRRLCCCSTACVEEPSTTMLIVEECIEFTNGCHTTKL